MKEMQRTRNVGKTSKLPNLSGYATFSNLQVFTNPEAPGTPFSWVFWRLHYVGIAIGLQTLEILEVGLKVPILEFHSWFSWPLP